MGGWETQGVGEKCATQGVEEKRATQGVEEKCLVIEGWEQELLVPPKRSGVGSCV